MSDLISIVVPVYNVEKFVERCLNSLIKQTYRNIEIIVVDDGSTDTSGEKVDEIAQSDPRFIVIHKNNGGLSDARNVGIEKASGKYITFIDSDDYVSDDYVAYLYDLLMKHNVKISTCFYKMILPEEKQAVTIEPYTDYLIDSKEAIKRMLYRNQISHNAWGKLYSIDLFKNKINIDFEKYHLNEKYKNFIPIQEKCYRFPVGILNEDLALVYYLVIEAGEIVQGTKKNYFYVSNPESITKSKVKKQDFSVFQLYEFVSAIIADYYPDLIDAILEFKETIYVKLYKRLLQNHQDEFSNEIEKIRNYLKKSSRQVVSSKVRLVTKIRVVIGALSTKLFIVLCKLENKLGAKS